jgi:pseudomonalisin
MLRTARTFLLFVAGFVVLAMASEGFAQKSTPQNRIAGPIVDSDVVTLMSNVHPLARAENDRGVIDSETRLERMVLVLEPSPTQQSELDALTEAQQEPNSGIYHQWLSPQEYGARFGVSSSDLAHITGWLASHGFAVEPVPAGRRLVLFSGTAQQVADTFHTEIHRYAVNGATHIANSQDPQIPKALAPVVSGVLSLHDFRRASASHPARQVAKPENTQGGTHYLFPADYATIYNLKPLYAAGKNGSGASIAIVGRSNINLSDVSSFRSTSGLIANQPTVILDGANPGLVSGDQDESTLDVEWSGAVAPGAAVKFVVAASTSTSDGVDLSAQYIVNNKTATVMSTSYGSCEAYMGSGEMAFYNSLWQQAASEGISSFVSSGDSGAAGCNGGGSSSGSMAGVNGLCSSPYSTCVGGTEFNEGSGNYWSSTNGTGGGSALSYIPEKVWNESASDGGSGLWSSGGGVSEYFTQPTWQKGISGANSNGMRAVPDVALTAASHDGYLICEDGNWYVIAGTSAASPSMAGIMSVVVQKQGGVGQGNANPTLYGMLTASSNPFHATPSGNNSVPGVNGFTASGASYNLATGLGSVDANLLATEWPGSGTVIPTPGFSLKTSVATESLLPGNSATFTVTVTATGAFSSAVGLTVKAPAGVTATIAPASVKPGASATVTLTVAASAAAETGVVTITGTGAGIVETSTVNMTVLAKPTLTMSVNTSKVTVAQGAAGTVLVTTTTGGAFTGSVSLAVTGLPAGVSAAWTGNSYISSVDGSTISTLTLKPSTAATLTTTSLKITATGDGLSATGTSSIQVTPAPAVTLALSPATIGMQSMATASLTATAIPVGGVSLTANAGSFKVTGLPAGITGSWGTTALTAAGTLQAKLTLTGSTSAVSSATKPAIAVSVTDSVTNKAYSASAAATLTVTRVLPTLALSLAATRVTMVQGQAGTLQITTTTGGSYSGLVTLAVTGLPAGVTATWTGGSFTRTVAGSTTSTLTLKAATTAAVASTAVKITATGDGVTALASDTVQVQAAPAIAMALSPTSINIQSIATQALTVTATPVGGASLAANAASFNVTGLPAGISASWGAPSRTAAGALQAQLTLTGSTSAVSTSTKPMIAISATDSVTGKVYSASEAATLTVTHVLPTLALSLSAAKVAIVQGQTGTLQVTTVTGGSYTGLVTLGVTGLPAGVTATWTNGSFTKTVAGSTVSTLTLKASSGAATATTGVEISVTGDGVTAQAAETIQVTSAPTIKLTLSPTQISMKSTATQAVTVTVTPVGGAILAANEAAFKITGLPGGVSGSWGAATVATGGALQATLTLTGSANAVSSTTQPLIAVSATDAVTGRVYTASAQATLIVTKAAQLR